MFLQGVREYKALWSAKLLTNSGCSKSYDKCKDLAWLICSLVILFWLLSLRMVLWFEIGTTLNWWDSGTSAGWDRQRLVMAIANRGYKMLEKTLEILFLHLIFMGKCLFLGKYRLVPVPVLNFLIAESGLNGFQGYLTRGDCVCIFVVVRHYQSNVHSFIKHTLCITYWARQWDYNIK